jgi:hypothetical protein
MESPHRSATTVEFDPVKGAFTFLHDTKPQMAMGMTEDDNGVLWSVTYRVDSYLYRDIDGKVYDQALREGQNKC